MSTTNKNQLVTIGDLEEFKLEIITAINHLSNGTTAGKPKKWLKSAELRKLIGVSPGKLQAIRDAGLLSFTKIGGNIYYDQDDVYKLFEENKLRKKK
jgi:hypothetical protein